MILQANKLNIGCLITISINNYLPLTPSPSSEEGGYFSTFQSRMLAYAIQPIKRRFKNDRHFKALWNQSCWTAIQSPLQHKHVDYHDFLHAPLFEWMGYFAIWRRTWKQDKPHALMSANVRDASDVSREFHTGDYVLNSNRFLALYFSHLSHRKLLLFKLLADKHKKNKTTGSYCIVLNDLLTLFTKVYYYQMLNLVISC